MSEVAGSEFELPCDAAFLAMGFTNPVGSLLEAFGVEKDARNNQGDDRWRRLLPDQCRRCLMPPVTCVAASRWSSGRFAKAARLPARSMPS